MMSAIMISKPPELSDVLNAPDPFEPTRQGSKPTEFSFQIIPVAFSVIGVYYLFVRKRTPYSAHALCLFREEVARNIILVNTITVNASRPSLCCSFLEIESATSY